MHYFIKNLFNLCNKMFKSLSIKILLVAVLCCGTYAGVIDKLSELNPFSAYKPVESEDLETTVSIYIKNCIIEYLH